MATFGDGKGGTQMGGAPNNPLLDKPGSMQRPPPPVADTVPQGGLYPFNAPTKISQHGGHTGIYPAPAPFKVG